MKKILASVSLVAFAAGFSAFPAQAVAPKEPVVCDLKSYIAELEQVKARGVASTTEELEVRRELLKASMDCNTREAVALEASVAGITEASRDAGSLKRRYSGELAAAREFTASRGPVIDALDTVEGSKELARQLKEWRDGTYNLLVWRASQLIVTNKNIALADSGADRVKQLSSRIDVLAESGERDAAQAKVKEAGELIARAQGDLSDAMGYLKNGGVPQQEQMATKQKAGLDALSRAYALLIAANDEIAVLPVATETPLIDIKLDPII